MSFQGDVGGIGLGELLQSLARGNREGVLVLQSREGLISTLGIQGGLLLLLPDQGEDGEKWRTREQRAFADSDQVSVDALRMSAIARAHRTETIYSLLDAEGVHFKFDPGTVPTGTTESMGLAEDKNGRAPQIFCQPTAVEPMLLEYARIQDESSGAHLHVLPSDNGVPRAMDKGAPPKEGARTYQECDGISTMGEIADRLGQPTRTARLQIYNLYAAGAIRFAQARELLVLFQRELDRSAYGRAAARLAAWCEFGQPGKLDVGDAQLLLQEWQSTRLPRTLESMRPFDARRLMRRLDATVKDAYDSVCRWEALRDIFPSDPITLTRLLKLQHLDTGDPLTPKTRDLLTAAKGHREGDHPRRAAALLRLAAERMPNTTSERLELGHGMLAANMFEEGLPWITEAASTLIEQGNADKAIAPLRSAVEAEPSNRALRRMLGQARARSAAGRKRRKQILIAVAIMALLGSGAFVQMKSAAQRRERIDEIASTQAPRQAMQLLESYFPASMDPEIDDLRIKIINTQTSEEQAQREKWQSDYREAQYEASGGDPLVGLKRALELPPVPQLVLDKDTFPLVSDLISDVATRLEQEIEKLGPPREEDRNQKHTEQRQAAVIEDILAFTATAERIPELDDLDQRLGVIAETILQRGEDRRNARDERLKLEKYNLQDQLLGAARAHRKAGDWERALDLYEQLAESDTDDTLQRALKKERDEVENNHNAVQSARELALEGRHDEARTTLSAALQDDISRYLLPWKVESVPSESRVRLSDGTVRTTPFIIESAFGEPLTLTFEHARYESRELQIETPADRNIVLSAEPSLRWRNESIVECLPVPDPRGGQVLADMRGRVVHLAADGKKTWETKTETLGGIARSPVYLPGNEGQLLVLTEEGDAYTIAIESGEKQGPYQVDSPLADGPIPCREGVCARFRSGKTWLWESGLKPRSLSRGEAELAFAGRERDELRHGSNSGLAVLRRTNLEGIRELNSPWADWQVRVTKTLFEVSSKSSPADSFQVRRTGEWQYAAFEAPRKGIPEGRLWLSDGEGVRAFDL